MSGYIPGGTNFLKSTGMMTLVLQQLFKSLARTTCNSIRVTVGRFLAESYRYARICLVQGFNITEEPSFKFFDGNAVYDMELVWRIGKCL